MRRAALLTVALLAFPAGAGAQEHGGHERGAARVSVGFAAFAPAHVDVLAGDRVTWANESARRHDVTADDGAWTSDGLAPGATYARAFAAAGPVAYHCSIHPFMRATVGVHELLLAAPAEPGVPGRPFTLHGRSALPAGTPIAIETDAGAAVGATVAGVDGSFAAAVRLPAPAQLRAVAGGVASPPVTLLVADREVRARARAQRGGVAVVHAHVHPSSPGARVVLQLRLRERFGWWPVRRARLDERSRTRFRVRPGRRVRARVVLTLADGATVLATSPTFRVGR